MENIMRISWLNIAQRFTQTSRNSQEINKEKYFFNISTKNKKTGSELYRSKAIKGSSFHQPAPGVNREKISSSKHYSQPRGVSTTSKSHSIGKGNKN